MLNVTWEGPQDRRRVWVFINMITCIISNSCKLTDSILLNFYLSTADWSGAPIISPTWAWKSVLPAVTGPHVTFRLSELQSHDFTCCTERHEEKCVRHIENLCTIIREKLAHGCFFVFYKHFFLSAVTLIRQYFKYMPRFDLAPDHTALISI